MSTGTVSPSILVAIPSVDNTPAMAFSSSSSVVCGGAVGLVEDWVTVKNGTVQGFGTGVLGDLRVDVSGVRITQNSGAALRVDKPTVVLANAGCSEVRYSYFDQNGVGLGTSETSYAGRCFRIYNTYIVSNGSLGGFTYGASRKL